MISWLKNSAVVWEKETAGWSCCKSLRGDPTFFQIFQTFRKKIKVKNNKFQTKKIPLCEKGKNPLFSKNEKKIHFPLPIKNRRKFTSIYSKNMLWEASFYPFLTLMPYFFRSFMNVLILKQIQNLVCLFNLKNGVNFQKNCFDTI